MHPRPCVGHHSKPQQPWQTGVRRFGYLSLHIELKYALRGSRPFLAKTQFACSARPPITFAVKINIRMRIGCGPMAHEVIEKLVPVRNSIVLHIAQRKRKGMINTDDDGPFRTDGRATVLRDFLTAPVSRSGSLCTDLDRFLRAVGRKKL
jgi:hypothetical protein